MTNPSSRPPSLPQARDADSGWRPHSLVHAQRRRLEHGHHHWHRRVDPSPDGPDALAHKTRTCADSRHPDASPPPAAASAPAEPVPHVAAADCPPSASAGPGTAKTLPTPVDPPSTPAAAIPVSPPSNESLANPGVGRGASSSRPGSSDALPAAASALAGASLSQTIQSSLASSSSTSSSWTSTQPSGLTTTPLSSTSVFPSIGDSRNGTEAAVVKANSTSSNSTASSASLLKGSALAVPESVSIGSSSSVFPQAPLSLAIISKSTPSTTTTRPSKSASLSASASTLTPASTSTWTSILTEPPATSLDGGFFATPAADPPSPPAPSNAGAGGGDGGHGGGGGGIGELSSEQSIIVGVTSTVSGVAIVALLVLLVLRYRKRRHGGALLGGGQSSEAASRSVGGGDVGPVAERFRPSAAAALLARLTGKTRGAPAAAPAQGGERGFYRVSGRKLPSVLHAGGDGYTDPRASVMSGSSDYFRGSQAFDPTTAGSSQLALGAPMRPVSGVPIMRSGPARTPVTENPFSDPLSGAGQPPGSPDTPRASASRFLERI